MKVGLRIDVDTYRGTKQGVPTLLRHLGFRSVRATFFFTVGPDNMGRHLWRLIRPAFLYKMLRSRAASLYGWDILFKGVFWPGSIIGEPLADIIRATADAGHEVGLHAWDHYAWQAHIDTMAPEQIRDAIHQGMDALTRILGRPPDCSAVPGWRCNDQVLLEKDRFDFRFNSDCRGNDLFRPVVNGCELVQPQIPVTLPTYDEVVGQGGITDANYNEHILSFIRPGRLNVLTIHAEVEGVARADLFERFLKLAESRGIEFTALGNLLESTATIERGRIVSRSIPGREGPVSCQKKL
jgi:undecaprenyl phosphate-alpha-L-ara4FN deformylase